MKVITDCPLCKKDFMYDPTWDQYLLYNPNPHELLDEYHIIKEGDWPSRRYNDDGDYTDLSGSYFICQECHENLPPDYRGFVEHVWEYERLGIPIGYKDLVRLAQQYRTPIPVINNRMYNTRNE